jgi:probable HAF family extracellular repeat protein
MFMQCTATRLVLSLFVGLFCVVSAARVLAASFTPLGDLAGGEFFSRAYSASTDGSVVVGHSNVADNVREAFLWTQATGMLGLGDFPDGSGDGSSALSVSDDGAVIVGAGSHASNVSEAFRWTEATGVVGLGFLSGRTSRSVARGVSADGLVVVGNSVATTAEGGGQEAFRWTQVEGMVGLGDLQGGAFDSNANAVSADGSVIVGIGSSNNGREAFRWTQTGGMLGLGVLLNRNDSVATGVSADGSVVVGYSSMNGSETRAFRWTEPSGMVSLGSLMVGTPSNAALAVSANGSAIVGVGDTTNGREAIYWTEATGFASLKEHLSNLGLAAELSGWTLSEAHGISADGRTIVGWGINPMGKTEGWVTTVPEPSTLMLACCALALAVVVRLRYILTKSCHLSLTAPNGQTTA